MADNSVADPGAGGDTFRTKDRSGVKTEVVGLDLTPGGGSETLMNGVMPVSDNSGSLTVDNAGTFAVQADTELTSADLDTGAGTDTRAVIGLVYANAGGATNVSTTAGLPVAAQGSFPVVILAGTASIGKLAANSGVVIGDVNVVSSIPAGSNEIGGVNLTKVGGTAVDTNSGNKSAGTQRVVLATDQPALTNALKVDGSAVTQPVSGTVTANLGTAAVTNAGTFAVQIAANSSVNQAQVAGTATSVNSGTKDAGTQRVILASDQTVVPISDNSGSLTVDAPLGTPVFTTVTPSTTGGWSKITALAQTTTKKAVKASAGTFGGYYAYNPNASVAYIQVFDLASGSVTLGTTAPDLAFGIPPASAANLEITNGVNMAAAITLACTTTAAGSTAPATGLDLTLLFK